jgi:hypothetical protein
MGAVTEVLLAFAAVHIAYRALKHFTVWGRWEGANHVNFTPGVVMILFTVGALLLCRRSFAAYGLTLTSWTEGLRLGLLLGMLLVVGGMALRLFGVQHEPGIRPPTMIEGVVYGGACLAAVVLYAWMLARRRVVLSRIPTVLCVLFLIALLCAPLVVAVQYGRDFTHMLLTVLWLVFGAACG